MQKPSRGRIGINYTQEGVTSTVDDPEGTGPTEAVRVTDFLAPEVLMILTCNFEEVTALTYGARSYLDERVEGSSAVAAPSATRGAVESLLLQLAGDLSVQSLAEQRELQRALQAVVDLLRERLDSSVLESHAAAEEAVVAYFDFAHSLSVLGRVLEMGEEMRALIEVMTGTPPDERTIREFIFPD